MNKMTKVYKFFLAIFAILASHSNSTAQCDVTAFVYPIQVCAGSSVFLSSVGSCGYLMNVDFNNNQLGVGWSSTAANPVFNNPCGPGPNGPHAWVGATTSSARSLVTVGYDVSIGGCKLRWFMRYGPNGGTNCESPDEPGEGVHMQYSTNNGGTWTDFPGPNVDPVGSNTTTPPFITTVPGKGGYWTPVSGNAATGPLYFWHDYEVVVPPVAATTNTQFRWAQLANSSAGYDAWGIDEVEILCPNSSVKVAWSTGDSIFTPGHLVMPHHPQNIAYDTCFIVHVWDSLNPIGAYDTVCVHVLPIPTSSFSIADTGICEYDSVQINYTGSASSTANFSWNIATQTYSTQGPFSLHLAPGTYSASLAVSENGCTAIPTSKSFKVYPKPQVAFSADVFAGCTPLSVNFINYTSPPNNSYLWSFGDGDTSSIENPSHTYNASGIYTLKLEALTSHACRDTFVFINLIHVYPNPVANFTANPAVTNIDHPIIQYTDISTNAFSWLWNFGDNSTDNTQNPSHTFSQDGEFTTWLVVTSDKGCKDSISYLVRVIIDKIVVPNVITPNGDGNNDFFVIENIDKLESSNLLIYNRWGKKVYESTNYKNDWNGNGAADGIYFYVIRYKTFFDEFEEKGTVTIMSK